MSDLAFFGCIALVALVIGAVVIGAKREHTQCVLAMKDRPTAEIVQVCGEPNR